MYMKERIDSVLKYAIYSYGVVYIIGFLTDRFTLINKLTFKTTYEPNVFIGEWAGGWNNPGNASLIILAVLIIIRFIVFGKTYQK